jgi:hypothetical protein
MALIRRETFVDDILKDIRAVISQMVPREARVTEVEFEGPELVIYVKNPEEIMRDGDLIKNLAKVLKKRISVRPDPEILLPPEKAEEMIKQIVPPEAEITNISFDPSVGEVIIEARKPGLVIGKNGETLNVTFLLYVVPIADALENKKSIKFLTAKLRDDFKKVFKKTQFVAVNLNFENGKYVVDTRGKKSGSSGILTNLINTKALMWLDEGLYELKAGSKVKIIKFC